jgi:3-oxoacyl-[acyl-carrier-protein] synthase-1
VGLVESTLDDRCRGSLRRTLSRAGEYAMAATFDAINDARIAADELTAARVGVAIGSTGERKSDMRNLEFSDIKYLPGSIPAAVACQLRVRAKTIAIQSACTTGLSNIGHAAQQIAMGYADLYIAGATEHVDADWIRWFAKGLLFRFPDVARAREAMRPFAAGRCGAVLSEGAGIVVLEDLEHAAARGMRGCAEVLGFYENNNGRTMYATDAEGVHDCVTGCLADARLEPAAVDYVNPHGAATPSGDATEAAVIARVFGDRVPVSATKAMNGHSMAATSAHELIHCILMLRDGFIAPSINCRVAAPDCAGINLVTETVSAPLARTLTLNAGFGGVNAAMLLGALP